jgi:hypothetical protein
VNTTALGVGLGIPFCGNVATAIPTWWDLDGTITAPTAAYQSIGAASFAASLVNLANPGTYDLVVGNAPAWAAGTGWVFDGINDYLKTGIVPGDGWSMVVQFSDFADGIIGAIAGAYTSATTRFLVSVDRRPGAQGVFYQQGEFLKVSPGIVSGNLAISGQYGYRNGSVDSAAISGWSGVNTADIYIGCFNLAGTDNSYSSVKIKAIAIYPYTLTADNVAALTTRMGALT